MPSHPTPTSHQVAEGQTSEAGLRVVSQLQAADRGNKQQQQQVKGKGHRWYLGGFASAGATVFTHPLDLLKVHLQTQQKVSKGVFGMAVQVVKSHGVLAFYNGLTASLGRQMTYSSVRFGVYDLIRPRLEARIQGVVGPMQLRGKLPFSYKILVGALGGFCGGIVGSPFDIVNIRMQNDSKLPDHLKRRYRHVFDGLRRIIMQEGFFHMWKGASLNICRAILMTLSQIAFYEQIKQLLLSTGYFKDNVVTHFGSSLVAGGVATTVTQPVDVMKTRLMSSSPGEFKSIWDCALYTARTGPMGFFKGYVPAFVRLGPQTVLTFIFVEQLRRLFPKT